MAKKTGFVVGAILGVIGGAVAALVTAPKEGRRFRKDVKDFYQDYKEDPKGKINEVKDSALNFYDEKSGQIVDFSTEKFNDIKDKYDNGEISAEKAKAYLLSKKSEIKAKIASGELSKDKVIDFLTVTKDKLADKVNEFKAGYAESDTEEEDFILELEGEDLLDQAADVVEETSEKVVEVADKVEDKGHDLLNK